MAITIHGVQNLYNAKVREAMKHIKGTYDTSFAEPENASFEDPQSAVFHPIKGWCPPDVAARSLPGSFQELDADNQRAMLANPPRARLTCDRNGLDEAFAVDFNPANLRVRPSDAADAAYMMTGFAQRQIAELKARIAVLEADNSAMIVRELDATVRMRHWRGRALKLAADLAMLKQQVSSPVKSSPVPGESSLPESEKSSQDAVWRNATRFSR